MAKIGDNALWSVLRPRINVISKPNTLYSNIVCCKDFGCTHKWEFPTMVSHWSGPSTSWDYQAQKYVGEDKLADAWAMLDDIVQHLKDKHEIEPCQYCGRMISSRGLKRHRKGAECTSQQRNFELERLNLVDVSAPFISEIRDAVKSNLDTLVQQIDWTDVELYRQLRDECQRAEDGLLDALQVEVYRSKYKKNSGWQEAFWVQHDTAHFLELARRQAIKNLRQAKNGVRRRVGDSTYNEELLRLIHEWIDSPDRHDAILGGMELALEDH